MEANAIPTLLKLLSPGQELLGNSERTLNTIKALTTLSEAPEAREDLLGYVEVIKEASIGSTKAVARAAEIALNVIQWKP